MKYILTILTLTILLISVCFNVFMVSNYQANVQRVLDKLCEQETDRLRTALAEARVIAQNNAQTKELIARLSPTPTPSRIVASPYTSIYPPATTTATTSGS